MFTPKTKKIETIYTQKSQIIRTLEALFGDSTRVYIDYANIRPWSNKLEWHIDLIRLKQFFDSFSQVEAVNFYSGYLLGDENSEREIKQIEKQKYVVRTKPVKIMRFSIDASGIPTDSTAILNHFVKRSLLRKFDINTIEYLNAQFKNLNKNGEYYIEDRKCNFDVEIAVDMLLDHERTKTKTFVLWSGDSDFSDPVAKLLRNGKKVIVFATTGKVSSELAKLKEDGLIIFEIKKIKEFICWNRELKANGTPLGAPKH